MDFHHGQQRPGFRLRIEVSEPLVPADAFVVIDRFAESEGYKANTRRDLKNVDPTKRVLTWKDIDTDYGFSTSLAVLFPTDGPNDSATFDVYLVFRTDEPIAHAHWRLFDHWRSSMQLLFPQSTVAVRLHPARFTDPDLIPVIVRETGIAAE